MTAPLVDVQDAAARIAAGEATLLDVREPSELRIVSVPGALHIPMRQVPARVAELPRDKPVLVICHHGGRSQAVADWLVRSGLDAANVDGGVDAWAAEIDPTMARY